MEESKPDKKMVLGGWSWTLHNTLTGNASGLNVLTQHCCGLVNGISCLIINSTTLFNGSFDWILRWRNFFADKVAWFAFTVHYVNTSLC